MQLSRKDMKEAYRRMLRSRAFEDEIHFLNEKGEVPGFIHLSAGQEANAVGICMHLTDDDHIASTHRGHGHSIAKGCSTTEMMDEIFARSTGICKGKGGSMHMADLDKGMLGANGIVGGGVPLTAGAALTAKVKETRGVAVAFFGDGAYNEGATLETMNLAKVLNLPMLFALENNGWGEATPASYSIGGDILARAEGFGIPAVEVDGFDFFAVHQTARELVEEIRNGGGPRLLHSHLYRYYGHFEGDAATYRPKGEADRIKEEKDCLNLFRKRVTEASLLDDKDLDAIDEEIKAEIKAAVEHAREAPHPEIADIETDVYASY